MLVAYIQPRPFVEGFWFCRFGSPRISATTPANASLINVIFFPNAQRWQRMAQLKVANGLK